MQHEANHTPNPDGTASLLVASLEGTWRTIRRRHPDVPEAVLVVASGSEGKRLNWGHFAPHRWQVNDADRHEVLVGGEGLHRGPTEVLGTLLHEAAHGLAYSREVQDTSRGGRYHNRRYATLARELGLDVTSVNPIGWSATTVPAPTAAAYASQLAQLQAALVLWRRQEHRIGSGTASAPCSPAPARAAASCALHVRRWRQRRSSAASAPNRSSQKNQQIDA
jgi:hypothetical protein